MQNILVVDDDTDLLTVLSHMLKAQGFNVTILAQPENVLKTIEMTKPNIIILDINMGEYDGREICTEVKNNSAYDHISVVLYSALTEDQEAIAKCKANLFLQKPLSTNLFLKKLKDLLVA